jgi:hypothetical protein
MTTDTYLASELNGHYGNCQFCGHRKGMLIYRHGTPQRAVTEYPTHYGNGELGWDWPERVPARWRKLASKAATLYA